MRVTKDMQVLWVLQNPQTICVDQSDQKSHMGRAGHTGEAGDAGFWILLVYESESLCLSVFESLNLWVS